VPGKDSVVEYFRSGQEKIEQGRVRKRKTGNTEMMFTGTMIEDLIATVERAQQRTLAETDTIADLETWFVSAHDGAGCDNKFLGAA